MSRVLVVDDVVAMAEQYAYDLRRLGGFQSRIASGGAEALEMLAQEDIDCVILDLEMPGIDGFEVLRQLQQRAIHVPVIVYTGTGDFDRCARAIRLGAYAFIDKADSMQRVVQEVRNAVERGRLVTEVHTLRARLDGDSALIGESEPIRRLREEIRRVAPIPSPVLILGESGTGKELVARDLHTLGTGGDSAFVALNAAAIPENLIESELFGHERGAFTGADRTRKGAFERAAGGTLFLDEIGELPAAAQAKLLRVLENRTVTRLGGDRELTVDARVVAATHRDLERDGEDGRFRQDLLFRLNVHVLRVPPLRDRRSDVPDLVRHFLGVLCTRFGMRTKSIDADALAALTAADWRRNNVRELRNIVERLIIAAAGDVIREGDLPADLRASDDVHATHAPPQSYQERRAEAERTIIIQALHRNDWQITRTAQDLGLADHASLLKIMRRLGIRRR